MQKGAENLKFFCEERMYELITCCDCYENHDSCDDWFIKACKQPHLLVWAKFETYPFWPAKIISVVRNKVYVRFFGEYEYGDLSVKDVFLLSKQDLNKTIAADLKTTYKKSILVCSSVLIFSSYECQ